jgi:hypothetical protein
MTEPFKNADQRIREAFAALRAEIEGVLGPVPRSSPANNHEYASYLLDSAERHLLDYAKQPASEG